MCYAGVCSWPAKLNVRWTGVRIGTGKAEVSLHTTQNGERERERGGGGGGRERERGGGGRGGGESERKAVSAQSCPKKILIKNSPIVIPLLKDVITVMTKALYTHMAPKDCHHSLPQQIQASHDTCLTQQPLRPCIPFHMKYNRSLCNWMLHTATCRSRWTVHAGFLEV